MKPADIQDFIYEQPAVLRRVLDEIPSAVGKIVGFLETDRIYLVGSGTSRNALLAASACLAEGSRCSVQVKGPLSFMEEVRKSESQKSVAIILSQTGTSTTTIDAVKHARRLGMRTITLTAEPESPIVSVSSETLIIPVGPEPVGPKTKGYSASAFALLLLGRRGAEVKLRSSPFFDSYGSLIEKSGEAMKTAAKAFRETDYFLVMGQGRHYATALEGALKITEMSGTAAAAFETEEAFHGRFHGLDSKSLAIFITASSDEQEMAAAGAAVLSNLGVRATIFNLCNRLLSPFDLSLPWASVESIPELDVLSAIVPFQFLGWHLAQEKGILPETMKYPGLSQKLKIKTRVGA